MQLVSNDNFHFNQGYVCSVSISVLLEAIYEAQTANGLHIRPGHVNSTGLAQTCASHHYMYDT